MSIEVLHRWHVYVESPALLPTVCRAFKKDGFRVNALPQQPNKFARCTVSHSSAGAITLWLLKNNSIVKRVMIVDI